MNVLFQDKAHYIDVIRLNLTFLRLLVVEVKSKPTTSGLLARQVGTVQTVSNKMTFYHACDESHIPSQFGNFRSGRKELKAKLERYRPIRLINAIPINLELGKFL